MEERRGCADHPERKARLQLIEYMFAGHSWQSAVAQSQLNVSRATAYRLRQLARDEEKAQWAFLDDRHGHPYKLTEPVQAWLSEFCLDNPQIPSRRVQSELQSRFGVAVSVSQINRVRAKLGVSNPWRGQSQCQLKKVYSDVLVPRGPVGKLGGKILGCRELVVLHDAHGHPLLATTHRGDHHLTIGLPQMLHCYEQAIGQVVVWRVVVDREGVAAEFLAQLHQEGRQVVTLLRSDQYEAEGSFAQVGPWQPWRYNRSGQVICEVAAARFALKRPDDADPVVEVEVALIRDWHKLLPVEGACEGADDGDWQADLPDHQRSFWQEGWQAMPAPPAPTTPKLLPVITTGHGMEAVELAQTYFKRWNCQENAIRDWLIPLNLDTNHGYAKEQVVNSELVKRQLVAEGRLHRLERLAQVSRARLTELRDQDQRLQEQVSAYEQRWSELSLQVMPFEATGQTEERDYFPLKARQVATAWEVRQRKAKREKHAVRSLGLLTKCEGYCRELRHVLRQQEDLEAQAREMYELDHAKDQLMTLLKLGLANLGMWVRDQYFGESYQHGGGPRLLPFFKLGGWVTMTASELHLEFCAFNNRALVRDLEEVCRKVNADAATMPDGRRLVVVVGKRLGCQHDGSRE